MIKPGRWLAVIMVAAVASTYAGGVGRAQTAVPLAQSFSDPAFRATWDRTDSLVAQGTVRRSFYWGPAPSSAAIQEDYKEGPGGKHLVQYFDKSRMEINNPAGDKSSPFYVTNGLLTRELISGQMQTGNYTFVSRYPAEIDIASDSDDAAAPTYASFRSVTNRTGIPDRTGQVVQDSIDRAGQTTSNPRYAAYNVKYAYKESAGQSYYNIPDVFWQFLNDKGPVVVGGRVQNARLSDPYFYATGYPISDAYWASVRIEGKPNTDVLIQAYERRVLTYVPSAPEGFRVQMGNIGQHYYGWRYQDAGKPQGQGTQACKQQIGDARFAGVWAANPSAQAQLGCYTGYAAFATILVYQPFQNGLMLDFVVTDAGVKTKTIYVLYYDGSMQTARDMFVDGSPDPLGQAPAGLYAPKGGFGKVWREVPGVQQRIGYALQPETGESSANSAPLFIYFSKGSMAQAGGKVYAMYSDTGKNPSAPNLWAAYDLP